MKKPNSIILKIIVEIDGQATITMQSADYTESMHQRDYSWKYMSVNDLAHEVFHDFKESDI